MKIRINKYIAQNTLLSRRKADEQIKNGKVTINDLVAKSGEFVETEKDLVKISGKDIKVASTADFEYILLNKPENVLSTVSDDRGRKTVIDLVNSKNRIYPVGRLDFQSSGLILLTNDGDLAYKMTHPKFHIPKTYLVHVKEAIKKQQLDTIKDGEIPIEDKFTSKTDIKIVNLHEFEITLYEGIKRQVRISCEYVGLTVESLQRISFGELKLGNLEIGKSRFLNEEELKYLNSLKT